MSVAGSAMNWICSCASRKITQLGRRSPSRTRGRELPARPDGGLSRESGSATACDSWLSWLRLLAATIPFCVGPAHAYDWLQFGGDARHSASNTFEATLTHANVKSLAPKYQVTLPASVDG